MKVLYVFRSLAVWGGIERILVDKMNHLVAMYGYDVYMLTTDQGQHPVPYALDERVHLEDLGIRFHQQYHYNPLLRPLVAWRLQRRFEKRLRQRLKAIGPDVIVCTTANFVDTLVRLKGPVPLIVESHSICRRTIVDDTLIEKLRSQRLLRALTQAQQLVALTDGDAADWRTYFSHVTTIPNMVHLNTTGRYSDGTSRRVLFVGRFDYQKRVQMALSIWQQVWPKFPDWELHIYGEGDDDVAAAAEALQMNISVHAPTDQIFDVYCSASLLMLTSLFEPFGLVIAEAMSCGLPVVAYDCPFGPSMIINHEVDGLLVEPDDEQQFANSLCRLMGDADLRQSMGRHAIASAQRFAAEQVMPQWKALFEREKRR